MEDVQKIETVRPKQPSDRLILAILCTIFCCMPLGIVSIVYSIRVHSAYDMGHYDDAKEYSDKAFRWAIAGAVSACLGWILYFVFVFGLAGLAIWSGGH